MSSQSGGHFSCFTKVKVVDLIMSDRGLVSQSGINKSSDDGRTCIELA